MIIIISRVCMKLSHNKLGMFRVQLLSAPELSQVSMKGNVLKQFH